MQDGPYSQQLNNKNGLYVCLESIKKTFFSLIFAVLCPPAEVIELIRLWFPAIKSCRGRCVTSPRLRSSSMNSFPNATCSSDCSQRTHRTRNILLVGQLCSAKVPWMNKCKIKRWILWWDVTLSHRPCICLSVSPVDTIGKDYPCTNRS